MAFSSNTYTATLDIKRRTPHRPLIIEGDAGVLLDLSLTDNGAAMDITGLYARCVFRRSDGRTVLVSESDDPCPMTVTKATGRIVITVPRTCFRDGDNFLQVQILDGDPDSGTCLSSTFPLLLRAYNCLLTNEAVEESVEFPILEWLIDALRNMTVTGVTIDPDDDGWPTATASLALTDGAYHLTLGIPRGNGIASVVVDSSNPQLIITYEDGTVALAMLNGIASQTWVEAQEYIDADELSAALTDYASKSYVAHEIAFSGHYTKPVGGIPASDLSDEVNASLDLADSAIQEADLEDYYQLPSGGIPSTDMSALVQLALARANNPAEMTGATASADGTAGVVPAPEAGEQGKYLRGDATWATIPVFQGASESRGAAGLVPPAETTDATKFLKGDGSWASTPSDSGKLDVDGDGSLVYATRKQTERTFENIPTDTAITLRGLLEKLAKWYVEIGGKYELPSGGIPATDLASAVQTSLGLADTAYQKPSGGIPASDLASGVIPEKLVVTYTTDDFQTATCDKTFTEIFTAWQAKTPIDVYIVMSGYVIATMTTMEILFASGGYAMLFTVSDMANNDYFRTTQLTHAFDGNDERITISQISTEPSNNTPNMDYENGDAGASSDFARADHRHPTDTSRSAKWKYKTLTLATSDWSASGNAYTCTKTVTGMTSTAIGVIEYSDYSYGITDAQGANSLTFTASAVPSAAVTVYVAFVEGEAV